MNNEFSFQQPLNEEPDGTYITVAQMQFFINREDGPTKLRTAHTEFLEYYNLCRVYNLVSDIIKIDEEAAIMYWDEKKEVVSLGFPSDGSVAKALAGLQPHSIFFCSTDEENPDEEFGLFEGSPWNEQ